MWTIWKQQTKSHRSIFLPWFVSSGASNKNDTHAKTMMFPFEFLMCGDFLVCDSKGQHYTPSEVNILQQLESIVVMPNYNRFFSISRTLVAIPDNVIVQQQQST